LLRLAEAPSRIAERTKANDPAGATREAEEGFARWQKQEAERRASAAATGVTLLEPALKTDLLRFDATAAAERVEKIASLQHEEDPKALFEGEGSQWVLIPSRTRDFFAACSAMSRSGAAARSARRSRGGCAW
jgi:hypothetical protein